MSHFTLPNFGLLDTNNLEEYYDTQIEYNNTSIQVDLNFENKIIDKKRLETVQHFIENIRIHDGNNKKYMEKDFKDDDGDTLKEYLEYHRDTLPTDDLEDLVGPGAKLADKTGILLKKLQLVRLGLYPDDDDTQFAVFDYSLGTNLTNYLVVVNTDENGNLDYITLES